MTMTRTKDKVKGIPISPDVAPLLPNNKARVMPIPKLVFEPNEPKAVPLRKLTKQKVVKEYVVLLELKFE